MVTKMHSSRMRTGRSLTVCLVWGVVSAWSGGDLPGPGGGVCLVRGGLPGPGGGGFSLPGGAAWRPHPVNRITDTCKNITLATTSLRPVINYDPSNIAIN